MPTSVLPRTRYARATGSNVAYQVVGDGPIDLVLAIGAWTHLELAWDIPPLARLLERLSSVARLIVFDKRGTGLSDRLAPDELPTLDQRMEDILVVMDAARSERAVLFGTLGAAAVCGTFAASHPDRTLGLILFGSFGKLESHTGILSRLADSQERALDRIEREWGTESVCVAFWAPSIVDEDDLREGHLRLARSALSPGSARTMFQLGFQVDWESIMPSIRVPTLVMHRTGDLAVPVRQGRAVADSIPGARWVELDGDDHLVWLGDQEQLMAEVESFLGELDPVVRTERILATVLFTDIVKSTEAAARLGDRRWREVLEEHHRIVRESLGRCGGTEVDTAGDGFLATFEAPAGALECARSIADDVRDIGLEIRAGVHIGECSVIDGKVGGMSVVIGARIMALAGAHEVLVSQTVKDLVAGSGLAFEDRGRFSLKGVPDEWNLYALAPVT